MIDRAANRGIRRDRRIVPAAVAGCLVGASAGCYERVVGVSGPGAAHYQGDVHEPNLKQDEHIPIVDDIGNALADEN